VRMMCHIFGCRASECGPDCERCGVHPYYEDQLFIAPGLLSKVVGPLRTLVNAFQARAATLVRSCRQCGKRLVIGFRYSDRYCSAKCEEEDGQIPF